MILIKDCYGWGFDGFGWWMIGDFMVVDDKCFDDGVRNKLFLDKK